MYRAVSNATNCINVIEAYNSGFKPTGGGVNWNHHTRSIDTASVIPASRQAAGSPKKREIIAPYTVRLQTSLLFKLIN